MQALSHPRYTPPPRSAVIISFEELNRARSAKVLDGDQAAPREAHPWAYAFPRPSFGESVRR